MVEGTHLTDHGKVTELSKLLISILNIVWIRFLGFFVIKQGKDRQKQASDLEHCLSTMKAIDCGTYDFCCFKVSKYSVYRTKKAIY